MLHRRHLFAFVLFLCLPWHAAASPRLTLQLNEIAPAGSAQDIALRNFKQSVESGSHGGVAISLHLAGGLGNPQTSVENMMFGDLDLFSGNLVHYLPLMIDEVSGLVIPFLVEGDGAIQQYLASPLLDAARDKVLTSRRIRFLEMTAIAHPSHVIASDRPLARAKDLTGLRMAVSQPLEKRAARIWAALGVTYVPLAPADIKAALREHKIDAAMFPDIATAVQSGVLGQVGYITGVEDTPQVWQISLNEAVWQRLGKDGQALLSSAARDSVAVFEKEAERQFRGQRALLTAKHVQYVQFDAAEIRPALVPLYDAMANEGALNPKVVETANKAMAAAH